MTVGSGNVFVDLGFDPAEAEIMKLRAEVMIRTAQRLQEQDWSTAEAARQLGIAAPHVSRLMKGEGQESSLDMLLMWARRVGLRPELRLTAV